MSISVSYRVAGIRMEIISSVGDPSDSLSPYMRDFASPGPADLTVELLQDERVQADPLKRLFPSKFVLTRRASEFLFHGVNGRKRLLGRISQQRNKGEMGLPQLRGPWRIEEEGDAVKEALQAFVKACLQCLLLKVGGTLLHAAGIAWEDHGYAFVGHTKAGKTTLMRDVPSAAVLGDDLLAVREMAGKPHLFGTPWPGREGGGVAYGGFPLRAIFNLHPELSPGLKPMGTAEAVAELATDAPRLGYEGEEDELLAIFSSVSGALPIYKLSFSLGDEVLSWLEKFKLEEEKGHRQGACG